MIGYKFLFVKQGKQNRFPLDQLRYQGWLVYSVLYKGGFCEYCIPFASTGRVRVSQAVPVLEKLF